MLWGGAGRRVLGTGVCNRSMNLSSELLDGSHTASLKLIEESINFRNVSLLLS
jgi:hypothetical protein